MTTPLSILGEEEQKNIIAAATREAGFKKIVGILNKVLLDAEESIHDRFIEAEKEELFIDTNFMWEAWEFLRDILVHGEGYLRFNDGAIEYMSCENVRTSTKGSLESTTYIWQSTIDLILKIPWTQAIRVAVEPIEDKEWRVMAWLPTGKILLEDFYSLSVLLAYVMEECILEVVLNDK